MRAFRLAACVAISATLLVSGCGSGTATATVTGTLMGADGACIYVRAQHANGGDLYRLRQLPPDYAATAEGLARPDGTVIRMGDSLTVSGTLSSVPFDRQCDGTHTLDATAIK